MFDGYTAQSLWDSFPGELLEVLTFQSQQPSSGTPTWNSYTLYRCRRKALSKQEKIAAAALGVQTVKFEFWQSSITNAVALNGAPSTCPNPKAKDRLTDAGGVLYIVQDLDQEFTGQAVGNQALWTLSCQRAPGQ